MRDAAMTLLGVSAASHNRQLDASWGEAIASIPEEAEEITVKMNAGRFAASQAGRARL